MEPYCVHQTFDDFDAFTESVQGWDGEFNQLGPGRFQSESLQYIHDNIHFFNARMNQHIQQLGSSPIGLRTFAIPVTGHLRLNWLGTTVDDDSILIFQPHRGLDCVSWDDFDMFIFSIPEQQMVELCHDLGYPSLPETIRQSDIIRCQPISMAALRRMFAIITQNLRQYLCNTPQSIQEAIQQIIPTMLINTLASAQETTISHPRRMRDNVIKQIKTYIDITPDLVPKVSDLCNMFNVSQRTLEYAFGEHFGIGPKGYLKVHRLNQVRRVLRQKPHPVEKVADAANNFGFWHMGQFAADYRNLFGELPSETFKQ